MSTEIPQDLQYCIEKIISNNDADLFFYSADIDAENADTLIEVIRKTIRGRTSKRENVVLILTTYGGDPDAAYRMTRFLKQTYKKFTLFVFGYCKSAGTLIAIGADEIVMSDFAELGPLDVQVLKENDFRRSSGLDLQQALSVLRDEMFKTFEMCFFSTVYASRGVVTTKMAAEIASSMAVGLLAPVAGQIDPLRIGELSRSMEVAREYGIRLNPSKEESISKLVSGYPSHGFVIDRKEAQELFKVVREPTEAELILEAVIYEVARSPAPQQIVLNLEEFLKEDSEQSETEDITDEDKIPTEHENSDTGDHKTNEEYQRGFEKNSRSEEDKSLYT